MACKQGIRKDLEASRRRIEEERRGDPSPKRSDEPPPLPPTLSQICWTIGYLILPQYAFQDCDKFVAICTNQVFTLTDKGKAQGLDPAGMFFYYMGCQAHNIRPTEEIAARFRVHHGHLDEAHDYFVLEYPTPPPFDLSHLSPEHQSLAPYFSVVVRHGRSKAVRYYALGQSPIGGTTFRSVKPNGHNYNHGPGPEPNLAAFLAKVRSQCSLEDAS